jgi:ribosome maturation factor RimP
MKNVDLQQLDQLVRPVVDGLGYDLVDLEWKHEGGHWVLRAFIDHPELSPNRLSGGVGHDDCSRVSHALSAELDVADAIHVPFHLEVSSPGLDRPLKRESDFRRFLGRKAKIRTRHPVGESRRNFAGTLVAAEQGRVRITVDDGETFEIPVDDVEKAHLEFEF